MKRAEVLLLRAIEGGRAQYGYRPVDGVRRSKWGPAKKGYEAWVSIGGKEVDPASLWALMRSGVVVTKRLVMHVNMGESPDGNKA